MVGDGRSGGGNRRKGERMERYYTVSEISERTGVPRRTLYDAINAGRLEERSCRTAAGAAGA